MKRLFLTIDSFFLVSVFLLSLFVAPSSANISPTREPFSLDPMILFVGGSGPGNYTKIQDAIENSSAGDIVFVYSGYYKENIYIIKTVHIIGIQNTTTIIDGESKGSVVSIFADNSSIQGFTIQNASNDIQSAGIKISTAKNVNIIGNIIQNNGQFGIYLKGPDSSGVMIYGNTFRNHSYGIYLFNSPQTSVSANDISDNGEGIYVIGSYASLIDNNNICNRGLGIHLENAYNLVIDSNFIVKNSNGIYVYNSSQISFSKNTIGWNRWYGVWTKYCTDNSINDNTIVSNVDVGLFLESSFDTAVVGNTFWDNDNGVYLKDSAGNRIQYNILRNYKMNACYVAHTLVHRRNIWNQNYWERARMVPYPVFGSIKLPKATISVMNFDWFPLKQPPHPNHIKNINTLETILYVGGTGPNNYTSIQKAIADAHQNDTIYVYSGTYYEAVLIDKPLKMVGENKTTTILEGNGTRDIITILADYVCVTNFSIQNGHFNVFINHSSFVTISSNIIYSGLHGVSLQNECRFVTIEHNMVQDNVYGIRIFSSRDTTISSNFIQSFKINAYYFGTSLAHGHHHWYHNLWEQPRHFPYLIPGKIRLGNLSLTWLNIDWIPQT